MDIAALIAWLVTAAGGLVLAGTWIARGGLDRETGRTYLAPPVVLGHGLLAAVGLLVWIIYVLAGDAAWLAWVAFVLLLPVAALGFAMFTRWWPQRRTLAAGPGAPAERHLTVPMVLGHGILAVVTLVLVLIAAIGATG